MNYDFWKGKTVFLTGHTGFKGGWLALWLTKLGAQVHGYSLAPNTKPSFFNESKIELNLTSSVIGDIRDITALNRAMQSAKPDIIIHMAAQPLVQTSYKVPVETYSINVMGTVNLFETARNISCLKTIIIITSDKCYENHEGTLPYREDHKLGGYDPYSSSKACTEVVTSSYRRSFFREIGVHVASVRAGNVIGGGDWAKDRLIPDIFRAINNHQTLIIRSPDSIRPWQHVLEPLSGYLLLTEKLFDEGDRFAAAWNFGPDNENIKSVEWIVKHLSTQVDGIKWKIDETPHKHEANILKLDSSKAKSKLGWTPKWNLQTALEKTLEWYTAWNSGQKMDKLIIKQIESYVHK